MKIEERLHEALHEYADPIEPDPDSWTQIAARFDDGARPVREPRSRGRLLVFACLASFTVVALIGVLLVRDTSDPDQVVTAPRAGAFGMPSRILAVNETGQPVVLDAATGEEESESEVNGVAEGTQIATSPNGQDAYLVIGNGNQGCADHALLRLPVGAEARGGDQIATNATDPTVSPDGRYLAYLHCSPEAGNRADHIVLLSLATGQEQVTSAPDGTYFYGRLEFAPDSNHVVFNLAQANVAPNADGTVSLREIGIAAGEVPPGREVGVSGGGGLGWRAMRGRTGDYLGVMDSTSPRVVVMRGPSPFTVGVWFSLPAVPSQLVSDASGDHVLAVVDHALYRWSIGDKGATKIADGVIGAAWIPDPPKADKTTTPVSDPIGVLVAFGGERLAAIGAQDGREHSSLGMFSGIASVSTTPDGFDVYFESIGDSGACGPEPGPDVSHTIVESQTATRVVGGAVTPVVSPNGKYVAYGITCEGPALGFTRLVDGENYRADPIGETVDTVFAVASVEVLGWSPDSTRLLYRLTFTNPEPHQPQYYVGQLWPVVRQPEVRRIQLASGGNLTSAAFVDDETLALAVAGPSGTAVHEVPIEEARAVRRSSDGVRWDSQSLLITGSGLFEIPGGITSLVAHPGGRHFLAVTENGELYRWVRGDTQPTRLAGDVTAVTWLPWS